MPPSLSLPRVVLKWDLSAYTNLVGFYRSATYNTATGDCRISDMDRHTVASSGDFTESQDDQYLENNCVDDPVKLCDFQLLENRIMKTVDSVYQVGSAVTMDGRRRANAMATFRYTRGFAPSSEQVSVADASTPSFRNAKYFQFTSYRG